MRPTAAGWRLDQRATRDSQTVSADLLGGLTERERLASRTCCGLVARWDGEEEVSATAWTAAGRAQGTMSIRRGCGGGLLVDCAHERDGASMIGHGVLAGDRWWCR